MRDLFTLPPDELREIKIEAYNNVAKENKLREAEEIAQKNVNSFLEQEGLAAQQETIQQGVNVFKPTSNYFGRTKRSHKPSETAPYHDARFVSGPGPGPGSNLPTPVKRRQSEILAMEKQKLVSLSTFTSVEEGGGRGAVPPVPPPAAAVERQAAGLKAPRPPSFPPPKRK